MKNFMCLFYSQIARIFLTFSFRKCRFFILLFAIIYAFSMQNSAAQSIKKFDEVLNAMIASGDNQGNADAARLKSLIYDVQPRLYVHENGCKKNNENPSVCLTAEPSALELLYEANPLFEQVELITLNILTARNMNFVLDLARLKSFSKLKYVQFLCNYDCNPATIMIKRPQEASSIIVFYQISLPE